MSFFFNDFFGGMPHGHAHTEDNESDEEPTEKDKYYTILEVPKTATEEDIKKAYKTKARQLHPDRHPDEREKYQSLFQELQQAYEVLANPQKREIYDNYGEKGLKRGGGGGGSHEMGDILSQFFGGGHASTRETGPKKSPAIKQVLDVTLEDLYRGSTKQITIKRYTSSKDSKECARCHGNGSITQIQRMGPMVLQQRRECPQCNGLGYQLESEDAKIDITIPAGGRHGETVTVANEGHKYPSMGQGDVIVQLNQLKHPVFKRQGADLGMTYKLSLREALCGYKIKIKHVSGNTLIITPKEKGSTVQPGTLKRVLSYGMPQRFLTHSRGHLYIQMEVEMPKSYSLPDNVIAEFAKILPNDKNNEDSDMKDEQLKNTPNKSKKKKGKNASNTVKNQNDEEFEDCETEDVDGNPHATPASAKSAYEEDEEDSQNVSCRQM